jgi:threonine/homoserine/homoserine lactone efflux protein
VRGAWTAVGVSCSDTVQGVAAAAGLGTVIVRSQPLFEVIRRAGVACLCFLGVQAIRSAIAGRHPTYAEDATSGPRPRRQRLSGWRQGFLSNVTNPKVLVFYLAVLPQFLGARPAVTSLVLPTVTHAILSLLFLLLVVAGIHRARRVLRRRPVRRALDAVTGAVLVGCGACLAVERH